jgi:hypothetical protein
MPLLVARRTSRGAVKSEGVFFHLPVITDLGFRIADI